MLQVRLGRLDMRKPILIFAGATVSAVLGLALVARFVLSDERIKSALEAQATAALGHPVAIQSATSRIFPVIGIDLTGVVIGKAREVTIEHATLRTGFRALLQRRVQDAEIRVAQSRIDVRWAIALLVALASSAEPTVPASPALTVDSIGLLELRDVTLIAGARTLLIDVDASLTGGDRVVFNRVHGRSEGSDFEARGDVTSVAKRTGTFSIDAGALDLDGLLAFLVAATPAGARQLEAAQATTAPKASTVPLNVEGTVRAKRGRVLGAEFSNLTTGCRLTGGDVSLDPLKVDLFGGHYKGTVGVSGSGREPRYEWQGRFDNLDVPQLVAFAGATGSMTGRLGGTVNLTGAGADPVRAMRRARGTARIAVTDGRVPGLEIVRNVILAFGKPSGERPEGSGEAFSRLAATLAIVGETATTDDLTFASRDFDMTGEGRLSLATQAIDFRTDVLLSRELSAQAGRDLYRVAREGDRIVLPARITGTASSPSVSIDVASALQRALRNKAEDEVKGLLDRLRKRVIK
jgi:uncharacterized protein involved in outer membrane biogenesis